MDSKSYEDLRVWNEAVDLAIATYAASKSFPAEERYGLTAQMRAAAVSVSSNVAEGWGRESYRERRNFLGNAQGSPFELRTQIEIANRLGFFRGDDGNELLARAKELSRGLAGLNRWVKRQIPGTATANPGT